MKMTERYRMHLPRPLNARALCQAMAAYQQSALPLYQDKWCCSMGHQRKRRAIAGQVGLYWTAMGWAWRAATGSFQWWRRRHHLVVWRRILLRAIFCAGRGRYQQLLRGLVRRADIFLAHSAGAASCLRTPQDGGVAAAAQTYSV